MHEHIFAARDGGTLARDIVEYDMPGGWLSDRLLVRRDLNRIFAYRRERLAGIFAAAPGG